MKRSKIEENTLFWKMVFYKQILDFHCPSKILCHTSKFWNFVKITSLYWSVLWSSSASGRPPCGGGGGKWGVGGGGLYMKSALSFSLTHSVEKRENHWRRVVENWPWKRMLYMLYYFVPHFPYESHHLPPHPFSWGLTTPYIELWGLRIYKIYAYMI
jgi:hypothetical protein